MAGKIAEAAAAAKGSLASLEDEMTTVDVLTGLLVVITGLYCFFTFKILQKNSEMVAQMKAQHESFIAPTVNIALSIKHSSMLCLTVRNTGQSAANNLRLSLDRDFHQFGKAEAASNLRHFPMFQEVMPTFAPHEELFIFLAQGFEMNERTPARFGIDIQYEFAGKVVNRRHEVNLDAYMRTQQDVPEMLQEIEKIRKATETIAKG